tara:strand:+ start:375 stop:863 length:489 start_codon:yes stop_codon:yes gene_type:complete
LSKNYENNFKKRISVEEIEEGLSLTPKFDENGLIPCITTDNNTGEVLMVGYMNAESLTKTIENGEAYYFSRSQQKIWHKGSVSGLTQKIIEMRIDDDQDSVWISVEVSGSGASCHVGYKSCFYRSIPIKSNVDENIMLIMDDEEKLFDPEEVYKGLPNPTKL